MNWELKVKYAGKVFKLNSEIVYHSSQIMRIKVQGNKGHILLENNYPLLQLKNSKKVISWKVKESYFDAYGDKQKAQLIAEIITQLEYYVKGKHNEASNVDYMRGKKSW